MGLTTLPKTVVSKSNSRQGIVFCFLLTFNTVSKLFWIRGYSFSTPQSCIIFMWPISYNAYINSTCKITYVSHYSWIKQKCSFEFIMSNQNTQMKFMFSTVCIYKRKFNVDFYLKTGNKNVHLDVSGTAFIVWLTSDLQSSRANQTNLSKQSSVCDGSRQMLHSRFRTSSSFFFN